MICNICTRCGKEINSFVNCSGKNVCHECCRRCFHHNSEISVLFCREAQFFHKLQQAGINIKKDGRITMANFLVVIPPFKPAFVTKAKTTDDILNIIYNKVSLKPRSISCHIHNGDFRLIVSKNQDRMSTNEKAMSIADETVKGTAIVAINGYGNFFGISEKAARLIAETINKHNREDIAEDVGA